MEIKKEDKKMRVVGYIYVLEFFFEFVGAREGVLDFINMALNFLWSGRFWGGELGAVSRGVTEGVFFFGFFFVL